MPERKLLIHVISNEVRNLGLLKILDLQISPFSRNDKGLCLRSITNYCLHENAIFVILNDPAQAGE
ncbi:MAG: hypothetical protein ACE5HX_05320 [bacterium]